MKTPPGMPHRKSLMRRMMEQQQDIARRGAALQARQAAERMFAASAARRGGGHWEPEPSPGGGGSPVTPAGGGATERHIEGLARQLYRGAQPGVDPRRSNQTLTFRVVRFDSKGDSLRPVPVEMTGRSIRGTLAEGDHVLIKKRWRPGRTLHPRRVRNLSTGGVVSIRSLGSLLYKLFLLAILGAAIVAAIVFNPLDRNGDGSSGPVESTSSSPGTQTVEVASMVGRSVDEAVSILSAHGLAAEVVTRPMPDIAKGLVFDQQPPPGPVPAGSTVILVVSSGPDELQPVDLPDLTGLERDQAVDAVRALGLEPSISEYGGETDEPEGIVVDQEPEPGPVEPGRPVTLFISPGPRGISLPDYSGMPYEEAVNDLVERGLVPEKVGEASSTVAERLVIRTDPAAGEVVDEGAMVAVYISTGPEPVLVPDVLGARRDNAVEELESPGFTVEVELELVAADSPKRGIVLDQSPDPQVELKPGETVTITVGFAPLLPTPEFPVDPEQPPGNLDVNAEESP